MKTKVDHYLDITSDICPITFVKTKLLIEKMDSGQVAQVRLSEGEPLENVPRSLLEEGHKLISLTPDRVTAGIHVLVLKKCDIDSSIKAKD